MASETSRHSLPTAPRLTPSAARKSLVAARPADRPRVGACPCTRCVGASAGQPQFPAALARTSGLSAWRRRGQLALRGSILPGVRTHCRTDCQKDGAQGLGRRAVRGRKGSATSSRAPAASRSVCAGRTGAGGVKSSGRRSRIPSGPFSGPGRGAEFPLGKVCCRCPGRALQQPGREGVGRRDRVGEEAVGATRRGSSGWRQAGRPGVGGAGPQDSGSGLGQGEGEW